MRAHAPTLALTIFAVVAGASAMAAQPSYSLVSDLAVCSNTDVQQSAALAVAACERAIRSGLLDRRRELGALQNLGAALVKEGKYTDAIRALDVVARSDPTLWQAYFNRGDARMQLKQYDSALQDFDAADRLHPGDPMVLELRCRLRAKQGRDLALALPDCDQSLRLRPDSMSTLYTRCYINYRTGNLTAAISDCTTVLERSPEFAADAQIIRGLARQKAGDTEGGNADIAAGNAARSKTASATSPESLVSAKASLEPPRPIPTPAPHVCTGSLIPTTGPCPR